MTLGTYAQNTGFPEEWLQAKGRIAAVVRRDLARVDIIDLDSGQRTRLRWNEDPPPASDAFWAIYEGYARSRQATLSEPSPVVGDVHLDGAGRIWVSRYSPDRRRYPRQPRLRGRAMARMGRAP